MGVSASTTRSVPNCTVEIQAERGVIYVHSHGGAVTLIRISGLTPEQCWCEQIDVRALQPRSHNESVHGYAEDGEMPEELRRARR